VFGARPCKFVPRELHADWATAFTTRVEAVLTAPDQGYDTRTASATHALLELAPLVLSAPNSSKGRGRTMRAKIDRVNRNLPVYGPGERDAAAPRRRQPEQQRQAQRVHQQLSRGSVSRAAAALDAAPIARFTPELPAQLAALHPAAAPPDLPAEVETPK
jgi:hypothetical protein